MDTISIGAVQTTERRTGKRPPNEWRQENSVKETHVRDFRGHYLAITHCDVGGWCKYIDGHFRGHVEILTVAMMQLEREACGEALAWGVK